MGTGMTMDTLTKTLHSVQTGCRAIEEFAIVLVRMAVEDALLCVARDYGHDYGSLLKRYRDEVVARHVSGHVLEMTTCKGLTKAGKQCTRRGEIQGYCRLHAAQMAEEASKRRKVEAYAAQVASAPHALDAEAVFRLLGVSREASVEVQGVTSLEALARL